MPSRSRTGYLVNIANPNFSGIATLTFCSRRPKFNPPPGDEESRKWTPKGKITTCYTESGFGVRQLAAALGSHFEYAGAHTKIRYTVGDFGLLSDFEVL